MTYDIFQKTAPTMPKPARGTEFIKFSVENVSKDMQQEVVPMEFPALSAHITKTKFLYSDNKYYELCGQMGHLIAPSGTGKAQLTHLPPPHPSTSPKDPQTAGHYSQPDTKPSPYHQQHYSKPTTNNSSKTSPDNTTYNGTCTPTKTH